MMLIMITGDSSLSRLELEGCGRSSQFGPLARPGPEAAAVEIVIMPSRRMFCDSSLAFLMLQRTAVATAVL